MVLCCVDCALSILRCVVVALVLASGPRPIFYHLVFSKSDARVLRNDSQTLECSCANLIISKASFFSFRELEL
jgi:hypothetical protein